MKEWVEKTPQHLTIGQPISKEVAKLLTAKLVDDLEIVLDNWTNNGEGYIYRLAVDLRVADPLRHNKPSLIVKVVGAGRLHLKRLTDKYNTETVMTTERDMTGCDLGFIEHR